MKCGDQMSNIEMYSVCEIRTQTGLPCNNCKYSGRCKAFLKKEGKLDGKKKQKQRKRKEVSSDI